ncbi:MAG: type II toxin-antitoxin system VapC family toxin [Planctomycetes bacterium]|nr:type II toxin-antitoxin system VapC family toxin [Planctomycetota bacterium]
MIYLLDTDVFTLTHFGKHGLRERIEAARIAHEVVVSIVTRIEVLRGRFDAVVTAADGAALLRAQELLRASEEFLAGFRLISFDRTVADTFNRLRDDRNVKKTGRNDLLIACIALANDATLVTRNTKDYASVPNLKLENWAS